MNRRTDSNRIAFLLKGLAVGLAAILGGVFSRKAKSWWRGKRVVNSPADFSLKTWRKALVEAKNSFSNKALPVLGAGVAYFATLAFFPLMAAAVAIAAFVISGDEIQAVATGLEQYLPADIASLVNAQLKGLSEGQGNNILIAGFSILLSLFSVSGAVHHLIAATNVAYGATEKRGIVKRRLISLVMTFSATMLGFVVLSLLLINGGFLIGLGIPAVVADIVLIIRWPLLVAVMVVSLAVFYRYGPDRHNPPWQWVSWGAVIATTIWLLGTILFFVYAQYFANFSETYSLFAGIIVLMIWLNVSAVTVLLGAEVNHRLESNR